MLNKDYIYLLVCLFTLLSNVKLLYCMLHVESLAEVGTVVPEVHDLVSEYTVEKKREKYQPIMLGCSQIYVVQILTVIVEAPS